MCYSISDFSKIVEECVKLDTTWTDLNDTLRQQLRDMQQVRCHGSVSLFVVAYLLLSTGGPHVSPIAQQRQAHRGATQAHHRPPQALA